MAPTVPDFRSNAQWTDRGGTREARALTTGRWHGCRASARVATKEVARDR
jgi:hypothetical protein